MPTATVVIVRGAWTISELAELVIELVPHAPPAVVEAVTVNGVEAAGVAPVVLIVSVDVVAPFVTVVGPKTAVAPVGAVQLIPRAFEVHVPALPAHVVVIAYVALEPAVTGSGFCVPTPVAVIVSGVSAFTVSVWVERY